MMVPSATAMPKQFQFSKAIVSGVSWYDQHGETVSAHGANIIRDGGKYYLFGEYKTDSANVFKGFSCYSSDNLTDWHFEGIVFDQQPDGRMGPDRVGERPKVLRYTATGVCGRSVSTSFRYRLRSSMQSPPQQKTEKTARIISLY